MINYINNTVREQFQDMVKNLKKIRTERGVSQQQLATAIGVSQQSVNKYENHNIEPDIRTLIMMADYFNTSVDYLIGHTTESRPIEPVRRYDLNDDESCLIDKYRIISKNKKNLITELIGVL